jgi:hypothetical protein
MPVKSKAHRARARNLFPYSKCSAAPKITNSGIVEAPDTSQMPLTAPGGHSDTHESDLVFDPDLVEIIGQFDDLENDFPDLYDPAESDDEGEVDNTKIQEISTLEHFAETLQKAQLAAAEAQRERENRNKRPQRYNGASKRTRRRHDLNRQELEKKGFISVKDFWTKNKKDEAVAIPQINLVAEEAEYISSDEENDIEIMEAEEVRVCLI